jgi:hypothetical protein
MKNKVRENYDYRLISKELWELLHSKYGGQEIKRFKDTESYSNKYIIKF